MIDWTKYFDRIYCINFIKYTYRKELIEFELDRVGLLSSPNFEWFITDTIPGISHLNVIKDGYNKGYNRILIIEDDIRFLKDLDKIEQIIQHRPEDANIIVYDKMSIKETQPPLNEYFNTFSSCVGASCYQLDRKGMKKVIQMKKLTPPEFNIDGFFYALNDFFHHEINCYCSNTNIAVQIMFTDSISLQERHKNNVEGFQILYKNQGINFDNYMMNKDGSKYDYGDAIVE